MTQPAGEWASSPEERRAESSASLGKRRSTLRSIRKAWVEEKTRMLLSSGGPTGSGGGRCRRFGNCHSFKGFHGLFFKKGRGDPEAKVPEDLWGCDRENIFTGKPWDGVGAKGREPVFRVKIIIEEALLCGKKNRAFLVKVTSFVGEVLRDRKAFILSGKREGRGTAWRLGRPTYKVGREGVVLRLDHQGLFGVDVPLTHGGGGKVVAARGSKQCPPTRSPGGTGSGSRASRLVG